MLRWFPKALSRFWKVPWLHSSEISSPQPFGLMFRTKVAHLVLQLQIMWTWQIQCVQCLCFVWTYLIITNDKAFSEKTFTNDIRKANFPTNHFYDLKFSEWDVRQCVRVTKVPCSCIEHTAKQMLPIPHFLLWNDGVSLLVSPRKENVLVRTFFQL